LINDEAEKTGAGKLDEFLGAGTKSESRGTHSETNVASSICTDIESEEQLTKSANQRILCSSYTPSQETKEKNLKEQGRIAIVKDLNWTIPSPRPRKGLYTGITLHGNVPHGFGTLEFATGDAYVGSFKGGEMHGVNGTYTSACGNHYKGEFQRNFRHGNGTETLQNGMQYVGRHAYGLPHGFGILYDASGSILQVGDWHRGVFVNRKKKTVISFETDVVKTDVEKTDVEKCSFSSSACSSSSSVPGFSLDSSKAPHSIYDETVSVSSSRGSHILSRAASDRNISVATDLPAPQSIYDTTVSVSTSRGSHILSRAASDRNISVATDLPRSKDKVSPAKLERYIPVAKDTSRSRDTGRGILVATDGAGSSNANSERHIAIATDIPRSSETVSSTNSERDIPHSAFGSQPSHGKAEKKSSLTTGRCQIE
jgi:hypothetical protein